MIFFCPAQICEMSILVKKSHLFSVCKNGTYIKDKACVSCQGHCRAESPCNKLTGRCDSGCDNFWSGEFCQSMYTMCLIDSFIVGLFSNYFILHEGLVI